MLEAGADIVRVQYQYCYSVQTRLDVPVVRADEVGKATKLQRYDFACAHRRQSGQETAAPCAWHSRAVPACAFASSHMCMASQIN